MKIRLTLKEQIAFINEYLNERLTDNEKTDFKFAINWANHYRRNGGFKYDSDNISKGAFIDKYMLFSNAIKTENDLKNAIEYGKYINYDEAQELQSLFKSIRILYAKYKLNFQCKF